MSDSLEWREPEASSVRYRRAVGALWRAAGTGVLVLPAGGKEPVAVVGAGRALWEVLATALTTAEAAALLADRFAVPEEDVQLAIQSVLADLSAVGALDVMRS